MHAVCDAERTMIFSVSFGVRKLWWAEALARLTALKPDEKTGFFCDTGLVVVFDL